MSAQTLLSQQSIFSDRLSSSQDSMQNRMVAVRSFNRARTRGSLRALLARLTRGSTQLQSRKIQTERSASKTIRGVQSISFDEIIGSEGRGRDFDDQFWPLKEHSRDRWVNIALAMSSGTPLPPVQLVQAADGYIVRDGNHRLSVARAFGRATIEAEIVM